MLQIYFQSSSELWPRWKLFRPSGLLYQLSFKTKRENIVGINKVIFFVFLFLCIFRFIQLMISTRCLSLYILLEIKQSISCNQSTVKPRLSTIIVGTQMNGKDNQESWSFKFMNIHKPRINNVCLLYTSPSPRDA